jgi:hypothetical protein
LIDIVADAVSCVIRAHVMALRHAFGDRSAEYERDSPLPSDLPSEKLMRLQYARAHLPRSMPPPIASTTICAYGSTMEPSARRRWRLCAALSLLVVTALEVLGYRILDSLADVLAASPWAWMVILGPTGFLLGRRLERTIRRRDFDRAAPPRP